MSALIHAEPGTKSNLVGTVQDSATLQPLPMVNVQIRETHMGQATDKNGEFEFNALPGGDYTLEVSRIGYDSQKVRAHLPLRHALTIRLVESFFQMNQVVVTSTRTEKLHRDVPVATEVISKKDIEDSGAQDVGELLMQQSGVSVSSTVTGESVIQVMGMDSRYVLILVDGQPITGKFNNQVSLDQIPTGILKQVEIIKGPNSALYGSEAMGGVINIVTDDAGSKGNYSVFTRYSGGDGVFQPLDRNIGERSLRMNLGRKWKRFSYQADTDYHTAHPNDTNEYILINNLNKLAGHLRLKWQPIESQQFSLDLTNYTDRESSNTQTVNAVTKVRRFNPILNHRWKINSGWSLDHSLRYTTYSRTYEQTRPWGTPVSFDSTGESESEYELNLIHQKNKSTINLGTEINNARYTSNRIVSGEKSLLSRSIFAQLDFWPFKSLNAVLGARTDYNTEAGFVTSPRLALMYKPGHRWTFRGTIGKGFRMPSFMDRYLNWTHEAFGYRIIGNPDLKPETSQGYTLGIEYYHPLVYQVSLMFYRTRFNQMINDYIVEPNVFSYQNIDRVQFTGLEIQGRWTVSHRWLASWGLNYIDNRDMSTGNLVPNTQPYSANVRLSYQWAGNRFKTSLSSKWTGAYYPYEFLPEQGDFQRSTTRRNPFAITDFTFTAKLSSNVNLDCGVNNCSDYTDAVFGPFIGRTYFIEFNINFNGD